MKHMNLNMFLKLKMNILQKSGDRYFQNMKKQYCNYQMCEILRTVRNLVSKESRSMSKVRRSWRLRDLHSATMILRKQHPLLAFLSPLGFLVLTDFVKASEEKRHLYNPDINLNVPQTIRRHGYPAEAHTVETADGYILTLHRIPGGRAGEESSRESSNRVDVMRPEITSGDAFIASEVIQTLDEEDSTQKETPRPRKRLPILLHHGLMGSSYAWVIAGPKRALAYLLADAGYDVWLANARGNVYSRAHVCLPTNPSSLFWDFSFHEIGVYDIPAEVEYILRTTGAPQLHYVGHSMGTTAFFVTATARPDTADKVASAHALAPVVFSDHMKSPLRVLAPFAHDVEFLARLLGRGQLAPETKLSRLLAKYGCETLDIEKKLCRNIIFVLYGFDAEQFDVELLPLLLNHMAHGASTKTVIHYAQLVNSGEFQPFDYGPAMNSVLYNSTTPPPYNLANVRVPVHLYHSSNDWLSSVQDVERLFQTLQCKKTKYLVPLPPFNHIDFILAKDVKKLLYDAILKQLPLL